MQLRPFVSLESVHLEEPRLKSAYSRRDEDRFCQKLRSTRGLDKKPPVVLLLKCRDLLPQMEYRAKGRYLLEQRVGEFLAGAHRHRGYVVDRLIRVEFNALPARIGQRVDDMCLDLQQAELEYLKQSDRTGADDHGVGLYRPLGLRRCTYFVDEHQRISFPSLSVRSFQSSASGGGTLRLVMLFQVGSLASSAFSLVMCCWSAGTSSSA